MWPLVTVPDLGPTSVLNWIAECEDHPGPEESDGVDYAAIYRYLALLCQVHYAVKIPYFAVPDI